MFAHEKHGDGQIVVKGSSGPSKLLDLAKKSQTWTSLDAERKDNRANEDKERRKRAEEEAKLAEQTAMAQLITEFFPFLKVDDAYVCLDCFEGDMQRIQNWLMDFGGNVEEIKKA